MPTRTLRPGLAGLLSALALAGCPGGGGGGGGGTPGSTVDVQVTGLVEYGFHVASTKEELVLEVRVLTPDGAPHPDAVFWWNYPGHLYGGLVSTPDPDLTYVEETGAGGLRRLRIRSTATKAAGLSVSCYADVFAKGSSVPDHQAVCPSQAIRFWGGKAVDLVIPFGGVSLGTGEVRSIEPLAIVSADPLNGLPSDEEVTCTVGNTAVAEVTSASSRCVFTGKAAGETTFTATTASVSRSWPLSVTSVVPGPPRRGAVNEPSRFERSASARAAGPTTGVTPVWVKSGSAIVPSTLVTSTAAGDLAFGGRLIFRQAVFEWTGTGFGWTLLSRPWVTATYPPALGHDARGALYAVLEGEPQEEVVVREPGAAPGVFRRAALPGTAPVTGVERTQLDGSNPFPRPRRGSEWFSTLPREGGGQWVAWVTVKGWDEYPDKLCRFTLELAEVDGAFTVRKETVLVSEKRWRFAVSGGASFDCTRTVDPINTFIEPVPELVATGPNGKPELDLWRRDSTFPFQATGQDVLTLTPPGLTHRHLTWSGTAWTSTPRWAPGTTRAVARSITHPPIHLADRPVDTFILGEAVRDRARPYPPDEEEPLRFFYFTDPRLLYESSVGAASTTLPGHLAFELDDYVKVTGWRVIDLVPDLPPQKLQPAVIASEGPVVRPPVVLPGGKRFVFTELWAKPYLFGDPGAKVLGASAAGAPYTVKAEPGATQQLPAPFELLLDRAWPVDDAMYAAGVVNATGVPITGRSADGTAWTEVPGGGAVPASTNPYSTAWIGPGGVGLLLSWGRSDVYRTADVRTGVWTQIDDLTPDLVTAGGALSNVRRDHAWAVSADGQTAVLASLIHVAGGVEKVMVRRYTTAGALVDARIVDVPPGVDYGLGDRFELAGAALTGGLLHVQRAETGLTGSRRFDLIPVTLDLATGAWTEGEVVASIYGADDHGENLWHTGLQGQFPALDRTAWSFLVFEPLADGRVAVFGSDLAPDGREVVFHASSPAVKGLSVGAKTYLRPAGGFHQRLSGVAPEPGGGWYVVYGDGVRALMTFGPLEHAWAVVDP